MRRRCLILVAAVLLGTTTLAGCQKRLFDPGAPRTQFELHDRMRNRYTPLTITDDFGREQPALRERLGNSALSM